MRKFYQEFYFIHCSSRMSTFVLRWKKGGENDDDAHDRGPSTAIKQYCFVLDADYCSGPVANTCDTKTTTKDRDNVTMPSTASRRG